MNNKDEIYYKVTKKEISPEDGFVDKKEIFPDYTNDKNELFYGYGKNITFESNDPRISLPFICAICSIFFIIGLLMVICSIIFKTYFISIIGIIFIIISLYAYFSSKKDIKNIAKKNDLNIDYNIFNNMIIGYKMIGKIFLWPIRMLINIFKK